MDVFKNDDNSYVAWHAGHKDAFVLNRFGGTNPACNVLHRSTCVFLWRDVDENARTTVEKWCSASERELADDADSVLGKGMWRKCGVCYHSPKSDKTGNGEPPTFESDPARSEDSVWIPGEPAVWLGSGEQEWKQRATSALKEAIPSEAPQWIDVDLRLSQESLYRKDLDNMLTPLLESARDAGWVERGFNRLGSVTSRKVTVSNLVEVGAVITPRTNPPQIAHDRIGVLIETHLTGLDADSVKWALYERAFELFRRHPDLRYPPLCPVSMDIRVMVNDENRRKSIQALIKPCIDGVEPILGHPDNLLPEPREHLHRRLAPQDEMVRSLAFHVRGGTSNGVSVLISPYQGLPHHE